MAMASNSNRFNYNSAMRFGRKAAIMHKFLNEEIQRNSVNVKVNIFNDPILYEVSSPFDDVNMSVSTEISTASENSPIFSIEKSIHHANPAPERNAKLPSSFAEISSKSIAMLQKPKPHKCLECNFKTSNVSHMKSHILCEHRNKNFRHTEHKHIKHNSKQFECSECFKKFGNKGGLSRHSRAHIDEHTRIHTHLAIREKRFTEKNQLILNMTKNHKRFPFACSKCNLPFALEYDKRAHEELCRQRQYKHLYSTNSRIIDARKEHLNTISYNLKCKRNTVDLWRPWA